MDDDDKNMRSQREAASWQYSTLVIPGIIVGVILLMVGSTVMSKMTPPAPSPTPSPVPTAVTRPPGFTGKAGGYGGYGGYGGAKAAMDKMNDPAFIRRYQEKSVKFGGDFTKLTPAEQKELDSASQGHGKQFFDMIRRR
jgi:hypothetical protein